MKPAAEGVQVLLADIVNVGIFVANQEARKMTGKRRSAEAGQVLVQ